MATRAGHCSSWQVVRPRSRSLLSEARAATGEVGRRAAWVSPGGVGFGRDPHAPRWYLNVVASPEVGVQILGERFEARARTAEGAERGRLRRMMTRLAPVYRTYGARSRRRSDLVQAASLR